MYVLTVPCRKRLQVGKRRLPILILDQAVIGLQSLEPRAKIEQVHAVRDADLVVAVKMLRTAVRLLPALVPPLVSCDAPLSVVPPPTTTAPGTAAPVVSSHAGRHDVAVPVTPLLK